MAEGHSLNETLGLIRVVSTDAEGHARLEYEAKQAQCHSGGVVQGGFISGWIDAAMAHAAMARNGPGIVPMTLELKISYFAPTRPGLVIAEAWVERHGKRTSFYEGRLKDAAGTVLAKTTSTILLADMNRVVAASKKATEDA
ncbi:MULTISPECIES: PaaI family thioesterase [unclassified Erythrobacter]|uniref:PaaI family thioesterase n=1 Tax=unclassified Erythrobacter TaxID=2633097 RepID=UPI0007B9814B|nr:MULTISPECIES: PaaI family thioesterase [unclassified Erythrobacter]KZY93767.1 thioesterase [Erythrobacter sp. HI0074]KZZ09362.1 thioesterase [Erythrobacter sp. HI0077]